MTSRCFGQRRGAAYVTLLFSLYLRYNVHCAHSNGPDRTTEELPWKACLALNKADGSIWQA
jgi:hypothetical protein